MIKVGLCGWTIGQREYFERFPVVEVQQTFYDPPAERTLLRWREAAPEGFEFTLKAWQLITHGASSSTYRRMKRPMSAADLAGAGAFRASATVDFGWETTLRCARILDATAVLFQCPASFRPTDENVANFRKFFERTERHELRFLWEPRGTHWPPALVKDLCTDFDLVHVVDPFVHETVTPDRIYYRLHGISGSRHVYTTAELHRVVELVRGHSDAYVMFNNLPRDGDSERFVRMLRSEGQRQPQR